MEKGIVAPAGHGQVPYTKRSDLAAGAAALLAQPSYEPREYLLNAGTTYSLADVAMAISSATGRSVAYSSVSRETFVARRVAEGFPTPAAQFAADWFSAVQKGAMAQTSDTLRDLIGHPPARLDHYVKEAFTKKDR